MKTIAVRIGSAGYEICLGAGARKGLPRLLGSIAPAARLLVVTDQNVDRLHGSALRPALSAAHWSVVPPGETSKSLQRAGELFDQLAAARIERGDLIVAFGGGVVGDLAGFVAATWLRGVRWVQIPTTLEAAIDASVGGKTGVNHTSGKNLIGAFHQPAGVVIDTDFLATLEARDWSAGLAESVKHAVIRDEPFFGWQRSNAGRIAARDGGVLDELIARNVEIKAQVVAVDEREAGLRAILNHGHTIGHGIEHACGHLLRHGECVGLGMIAENEIARRRGLIAVETCDAVRDLLGRFGLPQRLAGAANAEQIVAACRMDKKNRGGAIECVLLRGLGATERVAVTESELAQGLEAIGC